MKRIPFDPRRAVDWAAGHLNAEFIPDPVLAPLDFLFYILRKSEKNQNKHKRSTSTGTAGEEKKGLCFKSEEES